MDTQNIGPRRGLHTEVPFIRSRASLHKIDSAFILLDMDPQSFHTTRWSLVLQLRVDADPARTQAALSELCARYWFPLYAFLRGHAESPEEAEDLTQGFFEHLITSDLLRHADPEKGRLRAFLLGCLKHYRGMQWRKRVALRRGGSDPGIPLDGLAAEERYRVESAYLSVRDPEASFDRQWAFGVLERALDQLRAEHVSGEERRRLESLLPALSRPVDRAQLAGEIGMSEGALKVALHRLRKRYGKILREVVAETVLDVAEVDEELAYLMKCLRE